MWSPRAYARSHERTSKPFISVLLCERALTELEQSNNNMDEEEGGGGGGHWLHSEQGQDCFTSSWNLFRISAINWVLTQRRFKLKLKPHLPEPVVRWYRWHSLSRGQWSTFLGQLVWTGTSNEVLGYIVSWYSLEMFCTAAVKRYCKQPGRQSCPDPAERVMWIAANTVAEAMLKMVPLRSKDFALSIKSS